jgi:hypothetical protein
VTEYYAGGQYRRREEGTLVEESQLTPGRVGAILAAIEAIDWSAIPQEINAT